MNDNVRKPDIELLAILDRIAVCFEQLRVARPAADLGIKNESTLVSFNSVLANLGNGLPAAGPQSSYAWDIAVSIYPFLAKTHFRLACISRELAADFAEQLLTSKEFENGPVIGDQLEDQHFRSLGANRRKQIDYAKYLLDREDWKAASAWLSYLNVVGENVEFEFLKSKLIQNFPEIVVFSAKQVASRDITSTQLEVSQNIRAIEGSSEIQDPIGSLRSSMLGKFYTSYVKPNTSARNMAIWCWKVGYPIYLNRLAGLLRSARSRAWHPLISTERYIQIQGLKKETLHPEQSVYTPQPKVFASAVKSKFDWPNESFSFPEIYVSTLLHAELRGGSNLVLTNSSAVHHDLYDFVRDYTSEELHLRSHVDPSRNRVRLLIDDPNPEFIPEAAVFLDACSKNYAHWLTEVLPRLAMFCREKKFEQIPVVVDHDLHKNIMESLVLVAGSSREILTVPIGCKLKVGKLLVTSVAGYVPFERRIGSGKKGHSHGVFSPIAFESIRKIAVDARLTESSQDLPKKLYLRRNSGIRLIKNIEKLESLLMTQGFVIVEPEKLDFFQQVRLFSNASVVVASSGAALANMIFMPKGAKLIVLISEHPETSYGYWQNMACASGCEVVYVIGKREASGEGSIHADFEIDLRDVRACLKSVFDKAS
jgi:capsular polysaccharide biosynthesis protein